MNEITYYFGAGASCKSMPLVADFEKRFAYFESYISRFDLMKTKGPFFRLCAQFKQDVSAHLSFDTLFKKLYHQNEEGLIKDYKAVILIYFIFEHLIKVPGKENKDERIEGKVNNPDQRYEALIAGLLKPTKDKIDFYTRINFITWNYDANLTEAIRNFIEPRTPLHRFILSKHSNNKITCSPQASIIHLNGIVNHRLLDKGMQSEESLNYTLQELINEWDNGKIHRYSSQIYFSWEKLYYKDDELQAPDFVEEAQDAVRRSSNIIITGYSFPLYNRSIDSFILNPSNVWGKNVYIQSPNADEIKEILANDLNIQDTSKIGVNGKSTFVKSITNCSAFFVPNSIFHQTLRGISA